MGKMWTSQSWSGFKAELDHIGGRGVTGGQGGAAKSVMEG